MTAGAGRGRRSARDSARTRRPARGQGRETRRADFPIREDFEDHAGRVRTFVIECHEAGLGWTVRAQEEHPGDRPGYAFAAYSETSAYSALGRLRQKISRGLATRHVTGAPGRYAMLHDRLSGRITSDHDRELVLVVDGLAIRAEDLVSLLRMHEGWSLELRLTDGLE